MLPSCDEKPKEKATLRGDGGAGLGAARGGDSWEHALRRREGGLPVPSAPAPTAHGRTPFAPWRTRPYSLGLNMFARCHVSVPELPRGEADAFIQLSALSLSKDAQHHPKQQECNCEHKSPRLP